MHEQSTPSPGADARANSVDQRTVEQNLATVSALEQRITELFFVANAPLLAQLHAPTIATATMSLQQSIPPD
jgi:hypothetical protein